MITVTTPSTINTITATNTATSVPVIEGAVNPATAGTLPNVGFSNALNTQLGLATPSALESATLATAQAALLATTSAAVSTDTQTTNTVAPSITTTLTTQQPAALIENAAQLPTLLTSQTISPEMTMAAEDSAILSTVNDTLKFIETGSKLVDTLPAGQSVRLQSTNLTTPLTQQTVQSAVQQAVTKTQVDTPPTFLAQQATSVATQAQVQTPVSTQAQVQTPVTTQAQVQTPVTTQAQAQTPVATQVKVETPAATQAQVETPVTTQAQVEMPVATQAQVQTPVATQAQVQTSVAVQAQVETPFATQAQFETPVTTQAQVEMPVTTQAQVEMPVTTQAQVQTPVTTQAQVQTPVTTQAQVQTPVATQAQVQTPVTTQAQVEMPVVQVEVTEKAVLATPVQKIIGEKVAEKNDENTQITNPSLLVEIAAQTVTQNVVVEENVVEQEAVKPETPKSENQDEQTVQVAAQPLAPIVTAQAASIQVEVEAATFETVSTPEDKPTLTPAKNLLADVLANRSNSSDSAANNGDKRGTDTPTNPSLQADNSLKASADNRQIPDTKSFASLLATEKSDVTTATSTTPTVEKSAPQVMAAVNKLAETVKPEVPALTRPLSHPNWNEDMGERIVWMNNRGISSAEIRMNPQNMGPITVRIDMNQDQATIAFTAQNADVRSALEASIPKLREMLGSQNVNLANVDVSQQSSTNADSSRSQQQAAQMAADASANGQGGNRQNQNVEVDANGNVIRGVNANGEEIGIDEFANGQVLQDNGSNGLLSLFA